MPALRKAFLFAPFFSLLSLALGPICFAQQGQGQQQQVQTQQQRTQQGPQRLPQEGGNGRQPIADPNAPVLPRPYEALTKEHLEYIDQLLGYWETSSSKIERYKCEFSRYVYDEAFLNLRDPNTKHLYARTLATGIVQYAKPDKGMYESDNVWKFTKPPEKPGEEPKYEKIKENERWICDGQSIFEFKFGDKKLIERPLPPEMRGQRIADGPLPFLFGAKKNEMKARYWIRVITPQDAKGEYWLEAYPRRPADAHDMQKVEVILDESDFLPKAITMYEVNHNAAGGKTRKTTFEFAEREYNWQTIPEQLQKWMGTQFHRPKTPLGWQKVEMPLQQALPPQAQKQNAVPRAAQNQNVQGGTRNR